MHTRLHSSFHFGASSLPVSRRCRRWFAWVASGVTVCLTLNWASGAIAQLPEVVPTAPPQVTAQIAQMDEAASAGNLEVVMGFYSPNFMSQDGLTYDTLQQTLSDLWERYPNLTYSTNLDSWEQQGNSVVTVTTTTIQGDYPDERRDLNLVATITSRQRLENNKIVEQEILNEHSELSAGEKPPSVTFRLPDQVAPGEQFDFDAVVMEPLGDRLLLGSAIEESIEVNNYLNPAPIELELLSSGGLFKVGRAPDQPGDRWISAVIVRYDGIKAVTQRLRVVPRTN